MGGWGTGEKTGLLPVSPSRSSRASPKVSRSWGFGGYGAKSWSKTHTEDDEVQDGDSTWK